MALPRVSGRLGNPLDLNITFYRNGIPTDPYCIRKIEIYKSAVQPENLIAVFPIVSPLDPSYPSPLTKPNDSSGDPEPGKYDLIWDVPATGIPVPDIFFDVWSYIANDPGLSTDSSGTVDDSILDNEDLYQKCCNQFWLLSDGFYCDSGLTNMRFGFEPLDVKFVQPEIRTLEVGIMPLPLYDFDYNKVAPVLPQLRATFTLQTHNCEVIIDKEPMRIGLRQGTYRSNPFTLQYTLDTNRILRGSYQYQVVIILPNGETRASPFFSLQVS